MNAELNTFAMKKMTLSLLAATALLFSACGQPTYDADKPQESCTKMMEGLDDGKKMEFAKAVQKITIAAMLKQDMSLLQLAAISQDPEKAKELLRCMDGKTVDEIIAMADSLSAEDEKEPASAPAPTPAEPADELDKEIDSLEKELDKELDNMEKEIRQAADELDKELDNMEKELDKEFEAMEKEIDEAVEQLDEEIDDVLNELNEELEADADDEDV